MVMMTFDIVDREPIVSMTPPTTYNLQRPNVRASSVISELQENSLLKLLSCIEIVKKNGSLTFFLGFRTALSRSLGLRLCL